MKINIIALLIYAVILSSCGSSGSAAKQKLDNGFEYSVLTDAGSTKAVVGNYVTFNLDLEDPEGKMIQSMRGPGKQPMIQLMDKSEMTPGMVRNPIISLLSKVGSGDSVAIYIPVDSIPTATPAMKEFDHLIYRVAVEKVQTEEEYLAEMPADQQKAFLDKKEFQKVEKEKIAYAQEERTKYQAGEYAGKVKEIDGGLKIVILEAGTGANAKNGETAIMNYVGMLPTGEIFDNSFKRGRTFDFELGRGAVIQGWDKGILELNVGAKALLDIPYAMAYGERGSPPSIPANQDLFFYVELTDKK